VDSSGKQKTRPTADAPAADPKPRRRGAQPIEVTLVHARRSHASWTAFGLVIGVLLLWKLAIIGKILGAVFLVIAAFAARSLIRTLLHPPGTIRVAADQVDLPDGLCRGKQHSFPLAEVHHAFFLRRAVPWTRAGPVLVVEAGDGALTYPRDWFASEADQRQVLDAINERLGR
jgi:hypothetical protein